MIIQGKERQDACIHPECPAEQWKEEGARGRVQHTGNFTFITDISAVIAFHPKQRITENTEYLNRMTVPKDISEYYRIIHYTNEYFLVLQIITLNTRVLQRFTDYQKNTVDILK